MSDCVSDTKKIAKKIFIKGAVQGVGFRPFVFRLAHKLGVQGWVLNAADGVHIHAEGSSESIENFLRGIPALAPSVSIIDEIQSKDVSVLTLSSFEIKTSQDDSAIRTRLLPDLSICDDCLTELFSPKNRRFRYPFINCTNCGPRYSILLNVPYDRSNTTMNEFTMCPACSSEFHDPSSRRFHAQPNACSDCGPWVELINQESRTLAVRREAVTLAIEKLREGKILAIKGIGGYQLVCDANNSQTVQDLRIRKNRPHKPFAVMFPSIDAIESRFNISVEEESLLLSKERPIVLIKGKSGHLSENINPGLNRIGVMLPYSPLHAILMDDFGAPLLMTSGNLAEEPICTTEEEAFSRLSSIADFFLVHYRKIVHPMDDSVFQIIFGRPSPIRLARGFAPCSIEIRSHEQPDGLCFGGHMKNSMAIVSGNKAVVSQHIGDLDSKESIHNFEKVQAALSNQLRTNFKFFAHDLHADYASTKLATKQISESNNSIARIPVQHHFAHIASVIAEHNIGEPVFGVAWDGTGLGLDGSVWGGEFVLAEENNFKRVGSIRPFQLISGEKTIREPKRTALSLLLEIFDIEELKSLKLKFLDKFTAKEFALLLQLRQQKINCVTTTSAGRLFDAVSSLLDVCDRASYEGQAAMELEDRAAGNPNNFTRWKLTMENRDQTPFLLLDWEPFLRDLLVRRQANGQGESVATLSALFHESAADAIVLAASHFPERPVVLSGGCFQNKRLTESVIHKFQSQGRRVYWNETVPANDGGLALGQAWISSRIV